VNYEYTELYIPVGKKGWKELGSALVDLPAEGWELFMAVPITELTSEVPVFRAVEPRRSFTTFDALKTEFPVHAARSVEG